MQDVNLSGDALSKVIMVGDSNVGKTAILKRLTEDNFHASFIPTIGIDFRVKTIKINESNTVKLQIWDTAGQERFHALTTHYFRGSSGLMLVYDITNFKTFSNIAYWIKDTDEHAGNDAGRILIGNKCDMLATRQVSWEDGKRLAQEHGMQFFETSAKEDMNIEKAFVALGEEIIRKNPRLLPSADSIHIKKSSVHTCCTGRTVNYNSH
ncbi:ras-related protein Rab-10-like [Stegostoma tigrinum]|uniref:ras-related protein Rab-10-like n=1 Tax=Stegostoma tigrinum TaxID=3053191 RepID=UPI00202B789C|nr:ras-related protein Rab-10-like [Stegostoma tigrinum]